MMNFKTARLAAARTAPPRVANGPRPDRAPSRACSLADGETYSCGRLTEHRTRDPRNRYVGRRVCRARRPTDQDRRGLIRRFVPPIVAEIVLTSLGCRCRRAVTSILLWHLRRRDKVCESAASSVCQDPPTEGTVHGQPLTGAQVLVRPQCQTVDDRQRLHDATYRATRRIRYVRSGGIYRLAH